MLRFVVVVVVAPTARRACQRRAGARCRARLALAAGPALAESVANMLVDSALGDVCPIGDGGLRSDDTARRRSMLRRRTQQPQQRHAHYAGANRRRTQHSCARAAQSAAAHLGRASDHPARRSPR